MRKTFIATGAAALGIAAVLIAGASASGSDDSPPPNKAAQSAISAADAAVSAQAAAPVYQPSSETSYVPVGPCRIVDTRNGTGVGHTPIGANATRSYYVGGTVGFTPQGGHNGGCGIPVGAVAIDVTIATLNTVKSGAIVAVPNGTPMTSFGVATTQVGLIARTSSTLRINPSSAYALTIKNVAPGSTNLVIDVRGYYVKPMAGFISPSGTPYSGTSRILGSARVATGVYDVQFDRNIRYCSAVANAYVSNYFAATSTWFDSTHPDTVRVYLYNTTGAAADQYFYIQVMC